MVTKRHPPYAVRKYFGLHRLDTEVKQVTLLTFKATPQTYPPDFVDKFYLCIV